MTDEEIPEVLRERAIPLYLIRPGKRLLLVEIEVEDRPGMAAAVTKAIAEAGINVLRLEADALEGTGRGRIRVIGEAPPSLELKEFETHLREVSGVRTSRMRDSMAGFLAETALPRRHHGGGRVLPLTASYFAYMLDDIRSQMGSGGAVLVYEEGHSFGKAAWTVMADQVGTSQLISNLETAVEVMVGAGWGRPRIVSADLDGGSAEVRLEESFECSERTAPAPYSQFLRGYLAAAFEVFTGKPVTCTETQCVAKGDGACVFEVRAKNTKQSR